jgi:hypothetical protein
MKTIIITVLCSIYSIAAYTQVPFTYYTPMETQPNQELQQQPRYELLAGYYLDNVTKNFKRIKIKVNAVKTYVGKVQVYLRGIYNSNIEMWSDCNNQAAMVSAYLDGKVIADNFEWKVTALMGGSPMTIYFNY